MLRHEPNRQTFKLSDMAVWVIGAALILTLVKDSNGYWGTPQPWFNYVRVCGVILIGVGTFLAIWMGRETARRPAFFAKTAIILGLFALIAFLVTESAVLQLVDSQRPWQGFMSEGWETTTATIGLILTLSGLLLTFVPIRSRRPSSPPKTISLLSLGVVSSIAGIGIVGLLPGSDFYLVLLAIEHVRLALLRPSLVASFLPGRPLHEAYLARTGEASVLLDSTLWPSIHVRMTQVLMYGLISLASCLLTTLWLGHDLRQTVQPLKFKGLAYRSLTAISTGISGLYFAFVIMPWLQQSMAEGFMMVLFPFGASVIGGGFAILTAGISLRALSWSSLPVDDTLRPQHPYARIRRYVRFLIRLAIGIVSLLVIGAAASIITRDDLRGPWYAPWSQQQILDTLGKWTTITINGTDYFAASRSVESLLIPVATIGILIATFRLCFTPKGTNPLDQFQQHPHLIIRFFLNWFALMAVVFTLFPVFALLGLALIHFMLRA